MMETEPEENEPSESFYKQVQGEIPNEGLSVYKHVFSDKLF